MHQKYYELTVRSISEENHVNMMAILDKMWGVDYQDNGEFDVPKQITDKTTSFADLKTLDDLIGLKEVKKYFKRLANYPATKKIMNAYGVEFPKGFLLYGSPGTGKSYSVECLQGEALKNDVVIVKEVFAHATHASKFINSAANGMQEVYTKLVKQVQNPNVDLGVFYLDEFDSIGSRRGLSNNGEDDKMKTYLNSIMDGELSREDIVFVANTNIVDVIDPSYLRSGRFVTIECEHPSDDNLKSMFELYVNKVEGNAEIKVFGKLNYNKLVIEASKKRYTGADVKEVINRSVMDTVSSLLDNEKAVFVSPPKVYEKNIISLIKSHDLIRSQKTYDKQNEIGFGDKK